MAHRLSDAAPPFALDVGLTPGVIDRVAHRLAIDGQRRIHGAVLCIPTLQGSVELCGIGPHQDIANDTFRRDRILALVVALLILRSAWQLIRRSAHILLEGAPEWIDDAVLQSELTAAVPHVQSVHHVHTWMLTREHPLITLHAEVDEGADHHEVLMAITRFLKQRYAIDHATIQLEPGGCVDHAPEAAGK